MTDHLEEIVSRLHTNRWLAHTYLFAHRHRRKPAWFHPQLVEAWASKTPRAGFELFRGAAKSTIAEEALCIMALHREFKYGVILGETHDKAVERLMASAYELETNEKIRTIYGSQRGRVWNQDSIQLSNGTMLAAFGRGQNIRGEKSPFGNTRPDFILVDDVEDRDSVRTPEQRKFTQDWFNHEVVPALEEDNYPIRINGTRMHPESFIATMSEDAEWRDNWMRIPMWTVTDGSDTDPENPTITSNWPDKFPQETCRRIIRRFVSKHDLDGLNQEYLCRSTEMTTKDFPKEAATVDVLSAVPSWAPRFVIIDPARKGNLAKKGNARTGYLAFAAAGRKVWILEAYGRYHSVPQIVDETFDLASRHKPVWIAPEADGLEEFLMAPYRGEMSRRGVILPLRPVYAPRKEHKDDFIRGMQPFYLSKEIIIIGYKNDLGQIVTQSCDDLLAEMDMFPSGTKDVINCMAYIPQVRGGEPVYEDFGPQHIAASGEEQAPGLATYLVLHGDGSVLGAVLASFGQHSELVVREDFVLKPSSDEILPILTACQSYPRLKVVCTPGLFKPTGGPTVSILRRNGVAPVMGAEPEVGSLTNRLRMLIKNAPAFQVSTDATWSLRALSGGYARAIKGDGTTFEQPSDGPYKLIGEALESLGQLTERVQSDDDSTELMAYTPDGQAYLSVLPRRR